MISNQKKIYDTIDNILWSEWDPIGVNEIEEARDEYQSYTPEIFNLKLNGADAETISNALREIQTVRIELYNNLENCGHVAQKIFDL